MDFKCIKIASTTIDSSRSTNTKGRGGGGIVSVRSGLFVTNHMK